MSKPNLDPIHERIMLGIKASMAVAIERARQAGTKLIFWKDGKIIEISPDEMKLNGSSVEAQKPE